MKLFPPQPEVDLYNEGFSEVPPELNRSEEGKRLSELVGRIETPMVIAVDGPWGSGKTHFLKRWVGANKLENEGRANTIYFDAFASDYLNDPLIALTGAISERMEKEETSSALHKLKNSAVKVAKPFLRLALAAATAGASEAVGEVGDAMIAEAGNQAREASEKFWEREAGRRAAMESFRAALVELTSLDSVDDAKPSPLVIVVDELDRCRPDYALALLEVLKHFFAVPNVHFVLGVNLEALKLIVATRYGASVSAGDYLKRFITLETRLSTSYNSGQSSPSFQLNYLYETARKMEFPEKFLESVESHFKFFDKVGLLSMRDIERLLSQLALLPVLSLLRQLSPASLQILISLIFMRDRSPMLYEKALRGTLQSHDVREFYGFSENNLVRNMSHRSEYNHQAYLIDGIWQHLMTQGNLPETNNESFRSMFSAWGDAPEPMIEFVADLKRQYLDRFVLPSA